MKKNTKKTYKYSQSPKFISMDNFLLLPIAIVLFLVPLVVRLKVLTVSPDQLVWAREELVQLIDVFAYYKGFWLIIAALLALAILLVQFNRTKQYLTNNKTLWLLFAYLGFVLLSFTFSINKAVSFHGYSEHFENVFVLIAYIIIVFYTSQALHNEVHFKKLINVWSLAIVVMFLIGLGQFFGHDLFVTAFGQSLIIPPAYGNATASQDTDTVRNVYQTLFHYNYVSFYAGIGFPFFFVLSFLETNKTRKYIYIAIMTIFAFNQYASLSRNGYIGIIISLLISLIFLRNKLFKRWYLFIPIFLMVVIGLATYTMTSDSLTASRLRLAINQALTTETYPLKEIITYRDHVHIEHEQFEIDIDYLSNAASNEIPFSINKPDGNPYIYTLSSENNKFTIEGIDSKAFSFQPVKINDWDAILVTIDNEVWRFAYQGKSFVYINPIGILDTIPEVSTLGFEGRERFGSARGYIWSRTMPLLYQYGLLGSGPDTFPLVFPQNDYLGKFLAYRTANMVVDKPHNLYLNYAINTGIPSLLCLLLFWAYYLVTSAKLYIKNSFQSTYAKYGLAAMMATIGYLASGFFNDPNLNVTPLFWVILGFGLSANILSKKEIAD